MSGHVYPWWGRHFIDTPVRRPFHKPEKIVGPYVPSGVTANGFCDSGSYFYWACIGQPAFTRLPWIRWAAAFS
jgi:hypothetical protein